MKDLAYYTCYFGGLKNYSRLIPPLPSTKYDCYYFTNDRYIYNNLLNTQWIVIFMNNVPIHHCNIKNAMEVKLIKSCPHKFEQLKNYKYLCWLDSKIQVYENEIEKLITELSNNDNKIIVMSKHPYSDKFNSVWDEFNLAISYNRYREEKDKYQQYIENQLKKGFSEKINIHFHSGWILRKMCKKTEEYGEMWYEHILECGIECQIALSFIQQKYIDNIISTEYQHTWKYFYE
jgi:hypothetical protein